MRVSLRRVPARQKTVNGDMGLKGGEHGGKRTLCQRFPNATYRAIDEQSGLSDLNLEPDSVISLCDGNVMFMGTHGGIQTLQDYVDEMARILRRQLRAARVVCICFDDPTEVPHAKIDEQRKRDNGFKSISLNVPVNDDYSLNDLQDLSTCRQVTLQRNARYRMLDEVFSRAFVQVQAELNASIESNNGLQARQLVLDSIDMRGASRPISEPRNPSVIGTDEEVTKLICREGRMLGEADIKLRINEQAIRKALEGGAFNSVRALVTRTVDTDNWAISFLHHTERIADTSVGTANSVRSYICCAEQGKFAAEELQKERERCQLLPLPDSNWSSRPSPGVLFVDVGKMHNLIMRELWGREWRTDSTPNARLEVARIFVGAWVLGGCDYTAILVPFDKLFSQFVDEFQNRPQCLQIARNIAQSDTLQSVWTTTSEAEQARVVLYHMISLLGMNHKPTLRYTVERALWTVSYWSASDAGPPSNLEEWGFNEEASRTFSNHTSRKRKNAPGVVCSDDLQR